MNMQWFHEKVTSSVDNMEESIKFQYGLSKMNALSLSNYCSTFMSIIEVIIKCF